MAFDPDSYLSDQPPTTGAATSTFDPDQYLSGTAVSEQPEPEVGAPAPAFITTAPTGINPAAIKQGLQPMLDVIPRTYQQYMAPGGAVKGALDILGVSSIGVPPVAALETAKSISQVPAAVSKTASEVGKITSASELMTSPVSGAQYPSSVPAYREIQKMAGPEVAAKMSEAYAKGGNNAVLRYLESAPELKSLMQAPGFAQSLEAYRGAVPSGMSQLGRVVGPALRGAAKVAGPVGLAYDIYQAQPYMAQGGQELQSGQAAQRMGEARRSMLNAPTPAPLTDQELLNLLNSGDQRLINIYGGEAALQARMRRKAAEKVLAQ